MFDCIGSCTKAAYAIFTGLSASATDILSLIAEYSSWARIIRDTSSNLFRYGSPADEFAGDSLGHSGSKRIESKGCINSSGDQTPDENGRDRSCRTVCSCYCGRSLHRTSVEQRTEFLDPDFSRRVREVRRWVTPSIAQEPRGSTNGRRCRPRLE
jgi:hypothetical protein